MEFNFRRQIRNAALLLSQAMLGVLLLCGSAHATPIFHFLVDTSSLIGSSSGPFSLDFQFNNGGVLGNNTAVVNNLNYSGGSAVGSSTLFGGASGDLNSGIVFDNSSPFQELYQEFTPGTKLGFDVYLTSLVDGATPDAFAFAILDKNLFNIPTNGLGDSLLLVNLDSAAPALQNFAGTGIFSKVTTVVPAPASLSLLLLALPLFAFAVRRKREAE